MTDKSRAVPRRPPTLVAGSLLALLYAVGGLAVCLWVINLVLEDEGTQLSSGEQSGMVVACMGLATTAFGIFCIFRGLRCEVWAITLVTIGLAVGVLLGIGVTVTAFRADEDGFFNSGWLYLAITLFILVPVVLLSIAASKLPSPQDSAGVDPR